MEEKELRRLAKERASFKVHITVYLIIVALLAVVNYFTWGGYPWFLWVAFGWGIAILFHGLSAYVWDAGAEEREYQKLKAKEKRKR